jgi:hypothetical protein
VHHTNIINDHAFSHKVNVDLNMLDVSVKRETLEVVVVRSKPPSCHWPQHDTRP